MVFVQHEWTQAISSATRHAHRGSTSSIKFIIDVFQISVSTFVVVEVLSRIAATLDFHLPAVIGLIVSIIPHISLIDPYQYDQDSIIVLPYLCLLFLSYKIHFVLGSTDLQAHSSSYWPTTASNPRVTNIQLLACPIDHSVSGSTCKFFALESQQ